MQNDTEIDDQDDTGSNAEFDDIEIEYDDDTVDDPGFHLYEACSYGDLKTVRRLVNEGADLEASVGKEWTPLLAACESGHVRAAEILLQNGAIIDTCYRTRGSPLHSACLHGHLKVVQLLLEHGADVDAVEVYDDEATPLHYASDVEVVRCLFEEWR
jgi:ankyrin repeat protein